MVAFLNVSIILMWLLFRSDLPRRDSALRRLCTNFILTQTVPLIYDLFLILTLVLLYQERYVYVI